MLPGGNYSERKNDVVMNLGDDDSENANEQEMKLLDDCGVRLDNAETESDTCSCDHRDKEHVLHTLAQGIDTKTSHLPARGSGY